MQIQDWKACTVSGNPKFMYMCEICQKMEKTCSITLQSTQPDIEIATVPHSYAQSYPVPMAAILVLCPILW